MSVPVSIFQLAFYLGAILVTISTITFTVLQRHTDRPQNKVFIMASVCILLQCFIEIVTAVSKPYASASSTARTIFEVTSLLYFVLHVTMPLLLFYYSLFVTRYVREFPLRKHLAWMTPFFVSEVIVFTNPALHFLYQFDEDLVLHRNIGEYIVYIIAGCYFAGAMSIILFRWHAATKSKKKILRLAILSTVAGILVQLLIPQATVELFAEAMTLMGLMIAIEYDEELFDVSTNVCNRNALLLDLRSFFEMSVQHTVIAVQFRNLDSVRRSLGISYQELIIELAESIKAVHPRYLIYRPAPSVFLLVISGDDKTKARQLSEEVRSRILSDWSDKDRMIALKMTFLLATIPTELSGTEDVLLMSESNLLERPDGLPLEGEDLKSLFDQARLSEALHRGVSEHNFRMVYQMVYTADKKRPVAAEALLRLRDAELGDLYPSEFITVAERIGIIRQLGEYALREVCEFLQSDLPERLGIRFISVNLSIIQCTNPDFVENARNIVEEYAVKPERICFEISETAAAVDYVRLSKTIEELKSYGFLFSMDSYGSGYANMYSIFSMDFDLIKMDKNVLYTAQTSEEGRVILRSNAKMIHALHRKVVVIGVETKEQMSMLQYYPVDYVQGNYLSPAETKQELMERIGYTG